LDLGGGGQATERDCENLIPIQSLKIKGGHGPLGLPLLPPMSACKELIDLQYDQHLKNA